MLGLSRSRFGAMPGVRMGPHSAPAVSQLERGTTECSWGPHLQAGMRGGPRTAGSSCSCVALFHVILR